MNRREALLQAYRKTTYVVTSTTERIAVRIGQVSTALDRLLANHDAENWAILTAHNPQSELLPAEVNAARQDRLLAFLTGKGVTIHLGTNVADTGDWPDEANVLILELTEAEAIALGTEYGQAAVVVGRRGEAARLAWCGTVPR